MEQISLKAYAKINLALDVTGVRENGYHEVRMIMQSIGLYDQIELEKTAEEGFVLAANVDFLPVDGRNLMVRAAQLLFEAFSLPGGLSMKLDKHIPVAAGLAGGSTDAAAVLYGIAKLYELPLSLPELQNYGVRIGADVPFCLLQHTALAEGIGEVLTPLPPCPDCFIVLAKPAVSVSTKEVYQKLDLLEITEHPDVDGMIGALKAGDLHGITGKLANVLEAVTIPMHPEIREIKRILKENGALNALMSGSGPTVFALFETEKEAERAAEAVRRTQRAETVQTAKLI